MENIYLIKADESYLDILFEWANEEETRLNAFHPEKIEYEKHRKWFKKRLSNPSVLLFICKNQEIDIGQIRVEMCNCNVGIISYSVDKQYRGFGYGKKMLGLLEKELIYYLANDCEKIWLVGQVKYSNIASQKCFEKSGYTKFEHKDYLEYRKEYYNKR